MGWNISYIDATKNIMVCPLAQSKPTLLYFIFQPFIHIFVIVLVGVPFCLRLQQFTIFLNKNQAFSLSKYIFFCFYEITTNFIRGLSFTLLAIVVETNVNIHIVPSMVGMIKHYNVISLIFLVSFFC